MASSVLSDVPAVFCGFVRVYNSLAHTHEPVTDEPLSPSVKGAGGENGAWLMLSQPKKDRCFSLEPRAEYFNL